MKWPVVGVREGTPQPALNMLLRLLRRLVSNTGLQLLPSVDSGIIHKHIK